MRTTAFLDLLRSRRSRRFAKGMSIPDGPFAYQSAQEPQPLSREETGILIMAAAGVTGWSLGMPYTESGPASAGANYPSRLTGRSYPSAAGVNCSELIVVDDTGVRVTTFRDSTASDVDAFATADFSDFTALTNLVEDHLVDLMGQRPELPRVAPAIAAHNRWNANRPGTTLFAPVTDMAEMLLAFLSIFTGEGVVLWDPASDSPIGAPSDLLSAGVLHEQAKMPWDAFESLVWKQGVVEGSLMAYNAQLAATTMGLGGWLYTGIDSAAFLGGYQPMGIDGLGFATVPPTTPGPLNATGIHGGFETLARPFVRDAIDAVRRFDALKFGPSGTYAATAAGPFRDNAATKESVERYDDTRLEHFASVLDAVEQRFGTFTGRIPTALVSVFFQAQHADLGFYDTFYQPDTITTPMRNHDTEWHHQQDAAPWIIPK